MGTDLFTREQNLALTGCVFNLRTYPARLLRNKSRQVAGVIRQNIGVVYVGIIFWSSNAPPEDVLLLFLFGMDGSAALLIVKQHF